MVKNTSTFGKMTIIKAVKNFIIKAPWAKCYKNFMAVSYEFFVIRQNIFPDKPFTPSLMFAGKTGTYPSAPFCCSTPGQALALPANITQGSKGLPGTNPLAYCENS